MSWEPALSILAAAAIVAAALGIGCPIVRRLGVARGDRLATAVWGLAVGLVAGGTVLALLGVCGLLYAPLIAVLTLAAVFSAIGQVLPSLPTPDGEGDEADDHAPSPEGLPQAPWAPPGAWLRRSVLGLAAVACLGSLCGALAPPTAGDALCYHLELPKRFLDAHALDYSPFDDNGTFPLLTEMWYLWALALDGGVAAQLVHWTLGILLALAAVVLATPMVGRPWAWMAGAVVVLVPGVTNQMTAPLNDLALAAMTTLALAAWWRAVVGQEDPRWFVLAGIAAGGAAAVKYTAGIFAAAMAAWWICTLVRRSGDRWFLLRGAAVVGAIAVGVAGLWYARAAWHRGNPVYPFASELLVSPAAPPPRPETLPGEKSPLGRSVLALAHAPWTITMRPGQFGGRGHQLGGLLLAALPGLLLARRLRGLGTLLGVSAAYFVVWFLLRQNLRFLLPVVPPLAVGVVWVWIEMRRMPRAPRAVAAACLALVLVASSLAAAARSRECVAVALGLEDRSDFLARHEPSWPAASVANSILGEDARILSQEYRAYYFDRPLVRENIYRRLTSYDRQVAEPGDLGRALRESGFTHLLLAENLAAAGIGYDGTLARLADAEMAALPDGPLQEITEYRVADSDGAVRRYRLVRIR